MGWSWVHPGGPICINPATKAREKKKEVEGTHEDLAQGSEINNSMNLFQRTFQNHFYTKEYGKNLHFCSESLRPFWMR